MVLKQEAMETNSSPTLHHNNKAHQQRPSSKMEMSGDNLRQSLYENYANQEGAMASHHNEMVMNSAPSTPSKHMDTSQDDFKHQNFCGDTVVVLGK